MNIAIIPARIGSKRVKQKNIKIFEGKPLIYYSIKAAKKTKIFDKILVSTDSKKIRDIVLRYGAEVPFLRPKKLSDDYTGTKDVINHSIKWCMKNKIEAKYVCCIYPTAPFINYKNLIKSYKLIKKKKVDFIISASKFQSSVFRSFYLKNGKINKIFSGFDNKRSQELKNTYYDAGQFYWGNKESWTLKDIFSKNSTIFEIPVLEGFDLNTNEDWKNIIKLNKIHGNKAS
jgi:pseudaminic acid cytidylyltransferase